jgi:hypothetical protein
LAKNETSRNAPTNEGNRSVDALHDEPHALSHRQRRNNRIIALALAVFCLLVFAWIVVRMAGR